MDLFSALLCFHFHVQRLKKTIKKPLLHKWQVFPVTAFNQRFTTSWVPREPAGSEPVLLGAEESCMKSESVELQAISQSKPHPGFGNYCRDNDQTEEILDFLICGTTHCEMQNVCTSSESQQCTIVFCFFPPNTKKTNYTLTFCK